jgi:hypothetical protein
MKEPGCQPGLDFGWQVADEVTLGHVDPDTGFVVDRRAREDEQLVAGVQLGQMPRAVAKDGAVDGCPEA